MPEHRNARRALAAILAATVAIAPGSSKADNWEIVVPPHLPQSDALEAEIWDFFLRDLKPGHSLTIHDGLHAREVLRIAVPDDRRFAQERFKTKALGRETARLGRAIRALANAGNPEPPYRIAFPDFVYEYARARTSAKAEMLVVTSGMHLSELEPGFSFRLDDGLLFLPTDGHIAAELSESPYGTGGREAALAGVGVHFCVLSEAGRLTTYQKDELGRFWSLYVRGLGGEPATFTESLPGCFDRWRAGLRDGMPAAEPRDGDRLAMRVVTRTPLEGSMRPVPRPAPQGAETFSVFSSRPHPALPEVAVTTGIMYRSDGYPLSYERSWCYALFEHGGASIRVEFGSKAPHRAIAWAPIEEGTLDAAAISREQAEAGKGACQFPPDAI